MSQLPASSPPPEAMVASLLRFGSHLRSRGLPASQGRMLDLFRSISWIDMRSANDFYEASRCLLVDRWEDLAAFDAAFIEFWGRARISGDGVDEPPRDDMPQIQMDTPGETGTYPASRIQTGENREQQPREGQSRPAEQPDAPRGAGLGAGILSWSPDELLRLKDFAALTPEELRACQRLLAEMEWEVTQRQSRRLVRAVKGRHIDWLRSYRRNINNGCVLLDLEYMQTKTVKRPLIVLADVSGSMDRYTRPVLQLVHTMRAGHGRVEAFVFGTRLSRVTQQLRTRDADRALQRISEVVEDWAGGTKIGHALGIFNREWGRRVLTRGAVVIILSDGWDRGDPHMVRESMSRLQRRCHRLIWLNPAIGGQVSRPVPLGMQAALPFIDDLLPARNLNDLMAVGDLLRRIDNTRPSRRGIDAAPARAAGTGRI